MPSSKSHRNGQIETHRRGRSPEFSSTFHGNNAAMSHASAQIRRPRTVPDLLIYRNIAGTSPEATSRQPPKLLLKVTVLGSMAPVQVLISPECTVGDLVKEALRQYVKEGRRPILPTGEPSGFDLHYSQFSLETLNRDSKLIELGSRNFFLCPRKAKAAAEGGVTAPFPPSCATEVGKVREGGGGGFGWFKLMHFRL